MYTVTIWESDFDNGAFVAGIEEFTSLPEARSYFGSYFGDLGIRVFLEKNRGTGRDEHIATYDHCGVLIVNGTEKNQTEFILETHEMKKVEHAHSAA